MTAMTSPSTARNRDPILAVLRQHLPSSGLVLEIAAGAASMPFTWPATCPS